MYGSRSAEAPAAARERAQRIRDDLIRSRASQVRHETRRVATPTRAAAPVGGHRPAMPHHNTVAGTRPSYGATPTVQRYADPAAYHQSRRDRSPPRPHPAAPAASRGVPFDPRVPPPHSTFAPPRRAVSPAASRRGVWDPPPRDVPQPRDQQQRRPVTAAARASQHRVSSPYLTRGARDDGGYAHAQQRRAQQLRGAQPWQDTQRWQQDDVDVDAMSYEELLALEERIGVVVCRVPEDVLRALPTVTVRTRPPRGSSDASCAVCLDDYAVGAVLRCLPCSHAFHAPCIDAWLSAHKQCPMCKADVVDGVRAHHGV
jgi:hypothetical protein